MLLASESFAVFPAVRFITTVLSDVIGRRETGKTTLAVYLARLSAHRAMFDPRNGIAGGAAALKVTSHAEFRHAAMPALRAGAINEVIYSPFDNDLDGAFLVFGVQIKKWVREQPGRALSVVIDESFLVKEELDRRAHPIKSAMRWCARDRVHFFLTCHRPGEVPTGVRAVSDYWLLFQCRQEQDLDVIAKRCGVNVANEVHTLKPYEFVIWDDTKAKLRRSSLKPADWHIDLHAPAAAATAGITIPLDSGNLWL